MNHNLTGALAAIMDEYSRAVDELQRVLSEISQEQYVHVFDPHTKDQDCRSVQTIMNHVVRAGYGYANYIRRAVGMDFEERKEQYAVGSPAAANALLDEMLAYNAETLQAIHGLSEEEMAAHVIQTNWGQTYDIEQLLEHAIVHVLRHRRQVVRRDS